jgi:hypothetical protein
MHGVLQTRRVLRLIENQVEFALAGVREQQAATAEILLVVSNSATQRVFAEIATGPGLVGDAHDAATEVRRMVKPRCNARVVMHRVSCCRAQMLISINAIGSSSMASW